MKEKENRAEAGRETFRLHFVYSLYQTIYIT
jgi:hypothetical protein